MSQKLSSALVRVASGSLNGRWTQSRGNSSTSDIIITEPHPSLKGVQTLRLHRPPANMVTLESLQALPAKVKELEEDGKTKGIIVSSAVDGVFSAGLDLTLLVEKDLGYLETFASAVHGYWKALYGTPLAVVAAVNGQALAGGCMLASMADYRVAHSSAIFGLPEARLGIHVPYYLKEMTKELIGHREAEWMLTTGDVCKAEKARRLGLVDEVVETQEDLIKRSETVIKTLTGLNAGGRSVAKLSFRSELLQRSEDRRTAIRDDIASAIHNPKVQKSIKMYLQSAAKQQSK